MSTEALHLLNNRLSRLKSEHIGRLLVAASAALERFDPSRKITFGKSLEGYVQTATSEHSSYCDLVLQEVISLTEELLLPLSEEAKTQVFASAERAFDETLYLERFDLQIECMDRKGGRYGLRILEWGIRTDLQRAGHHVGAANLIRQTLAKLAEALELVRLRSTRQAAASLSLPGDVSLPFADLMNDTIKILKSNGEKHEGVRASVQRTKVFMDAGKLLVEPNDLIIRRMSNGGEETYRVIDPGFHEAVHGIKAHYQMEVQKLGIPEAKSAVQNIIYNISGNNTRINQNSVDNSTNLVQIDARAIQQIQLLRQELNQAQLSPAESQAAHEVVDEVENALLSGKPKKSVISALLKSLPDAANIASVVSAIIGLL